MRSYVIIQSARDDRLEAPLAVGERQPHRSGVSQLPLPAALHLRLAGLAAAFLWGQ